MISLNLPLFPHPPSSSSVSLRFPFLSPFPLPKLKPTATHGRKWPTQKKKRQKLRGGRGICRAELSQDAPFAIAIGACMLNSLLFPYYGSSGDEDEDVAISPTDARFSVMGIISFIPYFNWLSWVFAWMDTGKRRYAVYAIVYLAPYLRTNLSLSPEESWLPIASIVLCIIHIQLEASIRNGDLDGFSFFNEAARHLGLDTRRKDSNPRNQGKMHEEEGRVNKKNLPSGKKQSRDEIGKWRIPINPSRDVEHVNEDGDHLDDGKKQ